MNNKMAINTYLSTTESKKNEHAEQKQTHRYREHFELPDGMGVGATVTW